VLHYLEAVSAEDADVGWYSVTELDLDDVASYQLLGVHVQLLTFTHYYRELSNIQHHHAHCTLHACSVQRQLHSNQSQTYGATPAIVPYATRHR